MRVFVMFMALLCGVIWIKNSAETTSSQELPAQSSGQAQMASAAMRQLDEASRDPNRGPLMQCLGGPIDLNQSWPAPNEQACNRLLSKEAAEVVRQNDGKGGSVRGSPAVRSYVEIMLLIQNALEEAFHAGICQLRSEAFFEVFKAAQIRVSATEIQRLDLAGDELRLAQAELERVYMKARQERQEFDLVAGCQKLRSAGTLNRLDTLHRRWTRGYQ